MHASTYPHLSHPGNNRGTIPKQHHFPPKTENAKNGRTGVF